MGCSLHWVDNKLTELMYKLGVAIASKPSHFIYIPLLLGGLLATGFQQMRFEDDPEYLFGPENGRSRLEKKAVQEHFSTDYSGSFDVSRMIDITPFGRVIIQAKDGKSLFRESVWNEVATLDAMFNNITIEFKEQQYRYSDLCAEDVYGCVQNPIVKLDQLMGEFERGEYNFTYPAFIHPNTFDIIVFPLFLGNPVIEDDLFVKEVPAVVLGYFLKSNTESDKLRSLEWESEFLKVAEHASETLTQLKVYRFASQTLEEELNKNAESVIPYFHVSVIILMAFTVITGMMSDCVRSKPYMGLLGVFSSGLASAAAFGFIMYLGVPCIGINMAAPFLMLGIGIDDTFVMLAAWRRTNIQDSVKERMGKTYSDAAVSITITSITDLLSFWIGSASPFPSVRIFSLYTGTAVIFTYIWHITFFGGFMALCGFAEASNRHGTTFIKATPKSEAGDRNFLYRLLCTGGISERDPFNPMDNKEHCIMKFFGEKVGRLLNIPAIKALVVMVFLGYLGVACWGITRMQEGLERRKLARDDSYAKDFFDLEDKYFSRFPYRVQVMVTDKLTYSDPKVRQDLQEMIATFEKDRFVGKGLYTESWIKSLNNFFELNPEKNQTFDSEADFIKFLREDYFNEVDNGVSLDLHFNEDNTSILASRFVLQIVNKTDPNDDRLFMSNLRQIADESKFNVSVYHPLFIYFDQYAMVRSTTIQSVTIAAVAMMIVSLIFIPNPLCSLWVAFSIISIEVGVMGYMSLWKVNLDSISMINLLMCIGFSVDFSAHISYAYMSSKLDSPSERIKSSLQSLGFPIVQGSLSTIFSILPLTWSPSYIFHTFFKVIFLVIFFGAIHGLFLLPVLLSLFGPGSCKKKKTDEPDEPSPVHMIHPYFIGMPDPKNPENVLHPNCPRISRPGVLPPITGRGYDNAAFTPAVGLNYYKKKGFDSSEKDLGLGTSGEESSESSLSKNGKRRKADMRVVPAVNGNPVQYSPHPYYRERHPNTEFGNDENVYKDVPKKKGKSKSKTPTTWASPGPRPTSNYNEPHGVHMSEFDAQQYNRDNQWRH